VNSHGQGLQQSSFLHADVIRQLEAKVGGVFVVPGQVSIVRRCGTKDHVGAQVVSTLLAVIAVAAGHSRLNGHAVAHLEGGHFLAQLGHHAGCLVANDHRLGQHKVPDASVGKVVHVGSADAHAVHGQKNL